jgi:hypothetical protein
VHDEGSPETAMTKAFYHRRDRSRKCPRVAG